MKISALISQNIELTENECEIMDQLIPIKGFKKGTVLLREGQISKESFFVIEGLVRKYYVINGDDKTTEFYTEYESVASLQSYMNKTPATHYFECVEDCKLAVLSFDNEQELFKKVPKYETLCRMSMETDFGAQQEILAKFMISSPEERYKNLLATRPELLQRVPQYHLASYLGVKPESLSRIRKRIAKK